MLVLTHHEKRVLAFLDQRGPTARAIVVYELADPGSRIGWARDHGNPIGGSGSNAGEPMIMARWCRRLIKEGYVEQVNDTQGFYRHHTITDAGRRAIRN